MHILTYIYSHISADRSGQRMLEVNLYIGNLMDKGAIWSINPVICSSVNACVCLRDIMLQKLIYGCLLLFSLKLSDFHTNTLHSLSYDPVTCIY